MVPKDLQAMTNRNFVLTDTMCDLFSTLKDDIHGPGGDPLTKCIAQYLQVSRCPHHARGAHSHLDDKAGHYLGTSF